MNWPEKERDSSSVILGGTAIAAIALIIIINLVFPDQDAEHGVSLWAMWGELEARMMKATVGIIVILYLCSIMFGVKQVQDKISPNYDELRDIVAINKHVYMNTPIEKIHEVLPLINVAALAASINTAGRLIFFGLILAALLRFA